MVDNLQKTGKTVRGLRSIECALSLLYFAGQIHKEGISLRTLKMLKHNNKPVNSKKFKNFIKMIKDNVNIANDAANPEDMIRNIINDLGQHVFLENVASSIYHEWKEAIPHVLCSRQPSTISGAAVLIAIDKCKEDGTLKEADCALLTLPNVAIGKFSSIISI